MMSVREWTRSPSVFNFWLMLAQGCLDLIVLQAKIESRPKLSGNLDLMSKEAIRDLERALVTLRACERGVKALMEEE